jgi:ankyrin repeat protein
LLILNGANVNVPASHFRETGGAKGIITRKKTPLMYAAIIGNSEIAKILIKNGADVNAKDFRDNTALSYATGNINLEIVKILIENGADVNPIGLITRDGGDSAIEGTPLMLAVSDYYPSGSYYPFPDDGDNYRHERPKRELRKKENQEIIKLLLENKADVNIKIEGKTPLSLVIEKRDNDTIKLLKKYHAK